MSQTRTNSVKALLPDADPVYTRPRHGRDEAMTGAVARRESLSRAEKMLLVLIGVIVTAVLGMGLGFSTVNGRMLDMQRDFDGRLLEMQRDFDGRLLEMQRQFDERLLEMQRDFDGRLSEMQRQFDGRLSEMQREIGTLAERVSRIEAILEERLPPRDAPPASAEP